MFIVSVRKICPKRNKENIVFYTDSPLFHRTQRIMIQNFSWMGYQNLTKSSEQMRLPPFHYFRNIRIFWFRFSLQTFYTFFYFHCLYADLETLVECAVRIIPTKGTLHAYIRILLWYVSMHKQSSPIL